MRVDYVRDGLIEEFHEGIIVHLDTKNPPQEPYYLRSCAKPLQASLLVDYKIDLTPEELAFCSGSHAGEDCHVKVGLELLQKLGLDESYLKCGTHEPLAGLKYGEQARAIHNNCSGKHIGFLAICKKNGWDLDSYYEPEHPLQIEIKKKIYELCEVFEPHPNPLLSGEGTISYPTTTDGCGGVNVFRPVSYPTTTDGCGVPIVSMPLHNLVIGFKNLSQNYPQIVNAILNNPYIYGGKNRLDTEIIQKTGLLAKVGAGGLCVVYNTKLNDGFAVKMYDASMPARRFAVFETINKLGWADVEIDKSIKTINGKIVGEIVIS